MVIYKDNEVKVFYGILLSVGGLAALLTAMQDALLLSLISIVTIAGFLSFGFPTNIQTSNNKIIVVYPLRRIVITPQSLSRVKAEAAYDYRAHITLRNKKGLPIMYRCRQYQNASVLAQAVLDLISQAPHAKVDQEALKLLQQVAKGSTMPLV